MTIVMRVNRKMDVCEGIVFGFDWNKAYPDTHVELKKFAGNARLAGEVAGGDPETVVWNR